MLHRVKDLSPDQGLAVESLLGSYGAASGPWTTGMFVEAVYASIQRAPAKSVTPR